MSIVKTQDAEADIKEIYKYSFVNFGENQAEKYYAGLELKFSDIAAGIAHSKDYSFVREGLQRTNYVSHAIYYKKTDEDDILILRVLHQNMSELRHLESEDID